MSIIVSELVEQTPREATWQLLDRATAQRKRLLIAGYVPIPTAGKRPVLDEWQNSQPTERDIDGWARDYTQAGNTGILTRTTPAVDIDVLDVDVANELQALLLSMIGESGSVMVRFGQEPKRVILFQTEKPFPKIASPVFLSPDMRKHKVEVLCDGQQVVTHGIHPDTGRPYTWHHGEPGETARDDLPHLSAVVAADYIAKAVEYMKGRGWTGQRANGQGHTAATAQISPEFDAIYGGASREQKYARAALDGCAAELAQTPEGERNNRLNKCAFRMGTMTARGWIDRNEVFRCLLNAAHACGYVADDGEAAARKTLTSGLDAGEKVPHPDLDPAGPETWRNAGDESGRPADPLANFIFMGEDKPSPQRMLIEGVMPLDGLPFIGGQSSAGKTFITVLLAACAATGKPFFGRAVKERVGSIVIAAEGRTMLSARIAAALSHLGVDEKVPIAWVRQLPDFNSAQGLQTLARELRAVSEHFQQHFGVPLGLVFIDTVSALFDIREETDNAEAARVCKILRRLGEATGAVVVPIHHYGKNANVGLRGASAWRANADFVLSVIAEVNPQTGDVSNRQLAIAKDRDGSQGPLTSFSLEWVELGLDDAGQPWGSMVAVAEISTVQPGSAWPPSLSVFRQALLNALIESGFEAQPFADGPTMRVVDVERLKNAFFKTCHVESETEAGRQEARRKQFTRKLSDAQQRALVGVHVANDRTLVWLVNAHETGAPSPRTDGHSPPLGGDDVRPG
jgi:hypothetical protein